MLTNVCVIFILNMFHLHYVPKEGNRRTCKKRWTETSFIRTVLLRHSYRKVDRISRQSLVCENQMFRSINALVSKNYKKKVYIGFIFCNNYATFKKW